MNETICGVDCSKCPMKENCGGCINTNGHPFGGECMVAKCCQSSKHGNCGSCLNKPCALKAAAIREINSLKIKDMDEVTELNSLCGSFINVEYVLENGQTIKLLDDKKIYLGNQLHKRNSDRCYGVVADENYLFVCEYGENGSNPEIIVYKKRESK